MLQNPTGRIKGKHEEKTGICVFVYGDMLARLDVGHELSLELIKNAITGNGFEDNVNFLTV